MFHELILTNTMTEQLYMAEMEQGHLFHDKPQSTWGAQRPRKRFRSGPGKEKR